MDDQTLNLFKSIVEGLDYKQKQQLVDEIRNPSVGRGIAGLIQIHKLRSLINELDDLVDVYEREGWQDIDGNTAKQVKEFQEHYLKLHTRIIDYFVRIKYGAFSMVELNRYVDVQKRILLEDKLIERKREIQEMWDFYHKVTSLPDQIRKLPAFDFQNAMNYGKALVVKETGSSGEVSEDTMRAVLDREDDSKLEYLHSKWFLAKLFIEQQPTRIEAMTKEVDDFEKSFKKAGPAERQALTAFKRDQDPKYSAPNYNVTYAMWCAQFGGQIKLPEQVIRLILEVQDGRSR